MASYGDTIFLLVLIPALSFIILGLLHSKGLLERIIIFTEHKPLIGNKYFRIVALLSIILVFLLYFGVDINLFYILLFTIVFMVMVVIYAIFLSKMNDLFIKISNHDFFTSKRNQYFIISIILLIILLNAKGIIQTIEGFSPIISMLIISVGFGLFLMIFYWNYSNIIEDLVLSRTDSKFEEKLKEDTEKRYQEYMKSK